jgi:hypothetical protein
MNEETVAFAELAGVKAALTNLLSKNDQFSKRPIATFAPSEVEQYFRTTTRQLENCSRRVAGALR